MKHPDNADPPSDEFQQIMAHFFQTEQAQLDDAKKRLRTQIIPRLAQHRVANIKAAHFSVEEHERLREVLATRIEEEVRNA